MSEIIRSEQEHSAHNPLETAPLAGLSQAAPPFALSSGEDEENGISLKQGPAGESTFQLKSEKKQQESSPTEAIGAGPVDLLNYERMAAQAQSAIQGKDLPGLLSALAGLQGDASRIKELKRSYTVRVGRKIAEDLQQNFEGGALQQALAFLQVQSEGMAAEDLAGKLFAAIGSGSFADSLPLLSQLNGNAGLFQAVSASYAQKHGRDLIRDVESSFQGKDLQVAQDMLGLRQTTEKLKSTDPKEKKQAEAIIRRIYKQYGIDINTQAGLDALKGLYKKAPQAMLQQIQAEGWTLRELKALEKALIGYGPILGPNRADSSRAATGQELRTAGKVNMTLTNNKSTAAPDNFTLGEAFRDDQSMLLYSQGEDTAYDFGSDVDKQIKGTAVHEMCHLLMDYAVGDFVAEMDYWEKLDRKSNFPNAEAPITEYGTVRADEDLCEAVMFYFVEPETLKNGKSGKKKGEPGNPAPERFAFIDTQVKKWNHGHDKIGF